MVSRISQPDARVARGEATRARILTATRKELAKHGQDLTLDRVARRLEITKQAVLYHFPSKARLLLELAMLGLAEEAEAMVAAVAPARRAADAVERFVRASVAFHCADLERFRLIYIRPQVVPGAKDSLPTTERAQRIYAATSRIYSALETKLAADSRMPPGVDPRTLAVAIHLASIGFATMAGELEAGKETMKLPIERYAAQLAMTLGLAVGAGR